jgi:hypothetical protein
LQFTAASLHINHPDGKADQMRRKQKRRERQGSRRAASMGAVSG